VAMDSGESTVFLAIFFTVFTVFSYSFSYTIFWFLTARPTYSSQIHHSQSDLRNEIFNFITSIIYLLFVFDFSDLRDKRIQGAYF
jgi:hypothetical protein